MSLGDNPRVGLGPGEAAVLPRALEPLAALGETTRFPTGQIVFIGGETSGRVVLVRSGRLRVSVASGGQERTVAVIEPGAILGEVSAIDGEPHGATVVAIEPVEAVVIGAAEFGDFLRSSPEACLWVLRSVLRRLRERERERVEFVPIDGVGRVAGALAELARATGQSELRLSRAEVGAAAGVTEDGVSIAFRALRARGWIWTSRHRIAILDAEALHRRAG